MKYIWRLIALTAAHAPRSRLARLPRVPISSQLRVAIHELRGCVCVLWKMVEPSRMWFWSVLSRASIVVSAALLYAHIHIYELQLAPWVVELLFA